MKNILFLLADCLRADLVFGANRRAPTPTLDQLKRRGISFNQMISSATQTSPCVSSFFTGCYPIHTGVHALRGDVVNPSLPTLAELLQAHGYRTNALVTGPLWAGLGIERGFETYEYRKPGSHLSSAWRERIREISDAADPRPWFIYTHFFDLHAPRVVAPEFDHPKFGATTYERAVASFDHRLGEILAQVDPQQTIVVLHADHGELVPYTPWLEVRERVWQDYILGKKPPFLRLGLRKDPTVKAWTRLKRLTRMGHGFDLSEGLVRVPLILTGIDDGREGEIISGQVRQVDIMPTLLEAAGASAPRNLSGRSLLPILRGTDGEARPAYLEACAFGRDPNFNLRGLRTPEWKFIDSPTDPHVKPRLYSLASDPSEKRNVIRRHPDVVMELQRLIAQETRNRSDAGESHVWTPEENAIVEERLRNLGYF